MSRSISVSIHKKVFVAVLIVAVTLAFSPVMAGTAHAATSKMTMYKGQKIQVEFKYVTNNVTLKSSKAKIVKVKKNKKNLFTIQAKKAGSSTLTASAKNYKTNKYKITVKANYPAGSIVKPVSVVSSSWQTIKSFDGKKQVKVKASVQKGEDARLAINTIEGQPNDGTSFFDKLYYNDPATSSGKTLYLIKYDYQVVKGYPAGAGADFFSGLGGTLYNSKWTALTGTQYAKYFFDSTKANNYAYDITNGGSGFYYSAIFVANDIKELRSEFIGQIRDYQELGTFGTNNDLILTGCVTTKLQ